jgi:hypothetical protein
MKNKLFQTILGAAIALFVLSGMSFAKTSNVQLMYSSQVRSNLTLPAGKYRVVVNNNAAGSQQVAFYRQGKLYGKTSATIVPNAKKNSQTEVFYGAPHNNLRKISQIEFSGWKDTLKFGS